MFPVELTSFSNWVNWDKATKAPLSPRTGKLASCKTPGTWSDFSEAMKKAQAFDLGIGFVFTPEAGYTGVDLDNCFAAEGKLKPWAAGVVRLLDSYTEFSPSGNGLHVIVKGRLSGNGLHPKGIGVFSELRYFTMTAKIFCDKCSIEDRQHELDILCQKLTYAQQQKFSAGNKTSQNHSQPTSYTDEQIFRYLEMHPGKRRDLWRGEWKNHNYPSASEADFAFVAYLSRMSSSSEQIDRIFRQSGLMRSKWSETHYGERCIAKVLGR